MQMEENLPISQQLLITPLNGRPHRYRIITTTCVVLAIKNPLYTVSGEMQMEENLPISQQLLITPLNGRPHRYRIITTIPYLAWHTSGI